MRKKKAIFFLILSAVLWSLGGVLIKIVDLNPIAIAGTRSAIASLVILIYLKKIKPSFNPIQITGALFYSGTVILFVLANKLTTAANAILLQYGAPLYVALLSYPILKEKVDRIDWIAILLMLIGIYIFFLDELQFNNFIGNIIAILSGINFAFFIIFMRKQKDNSPINSVLLGNIITALIGLPFIIRSFNLINLKNFIGLTLLGTIQIGISYILYSIAIKEVSALEGALIPMIEPILNPIWVFLAIGEIPGKYSLLGGSIILATVSLRYLYPAIKNRYDKIYL
ncbi:MAG: EamA family transporter [Dictyoglomus sp.]|nr:EamA family transporter [Dictyoglomus sp.]MDW8188987.1 EamA family transporter [Dictyoglomus sp.]